VNINFNRKRRDPDREGQMRVRYAPAKRNLAQLKWRLTLLIVLSPLLYFLSKIILGFFLEPASGFVMLDTYHYQCPADGTVKAFYVEVGQNVAENQLLLVVEDYELERKIAEIRSQLSEMQATNNNDLTAEYLDEQVALARAAVNHQQQQFADIDFLFRQGATTIAEHSAAKNYLNAAKARLSTRAYEQRQWLVKSAAATSLGETGSMVAKDLRKKLIVLTEEHRRLSLYALYPGRVTAVFVAKAQLVQKAEPAVAISRPSNPRILAYLEPKNSNRAENGAIVQIELPSGREVNARVQDNPGVTGRLPSYLSSPMSGRQRMILVYLQPLEPLPTNEIVDGLPVKVYFPTPGRKVLEKFLALFSV